MSDSKQIGSAVITGASQGIGAVYARKLAERGHDVILVARDETHLREQAAEISAATGRSAEVWAADLTDPAQVSRLAERLAKDVSISVLVNNAGVSLDRGFLTHDAEDVARMIALNIAAPTLLARAAANAFIARRKGAIVNISSVTAFLPETFDGAYSGSKAYILNLTQNLARAVKDSGVKVQAVLPGPTDTPMWARSGIPASVLPPERIMAPEDLVEAALAGLDRGEIVTLPSVHDESVWSAFEAARLALGPHLAAGKPAPRYGVAARAL